MRYQRPELPLKLDGLRAARDFFAGCIAESDVRRETLWVAHVDEEARCLHLSRHDCNGADGSFPIAKIIADAAAHHSAGIVLAQRHSSAEPRPGEQHCRVAKQLAAAAEPLDCTILDHLLFAGPRCTSMRQLGYL